MNLSRRTFVGVVLAAGARGAVGRADTDDRIEWHTIKPHDLRGRGWAETSPEFGRLPGWAQGRVTSGVWNNGRCAAGQYLDFTTDSPELRVTWALGSGELGMWHMTEAGKSGLDLYARDQMGRLRWYAVAGPGGQQTRDRVLARPPTGLNHFRLYMPLYNELTELSIGTRSNARWEVARHDDAKRRPIVFYGSSIMQGCSASRPGMAFAAILGRRLGVETINLGFSGSAKMEPVLADLLGEIEASAYAIDAMPNMNPNQVRERAVPFVERLRAKRGETPILLVEGRAFTNAWAEPGRSRYAAERRAALQDAYDALVKSGIGGLHYLTSDRLLGDDSEAAIDGSHPTDLGMMRYADAYEPVLRKMLG
ncbi:MAG: hypothetical protein D6695_12610 [Planctomycetota bacterium]|nr:MAG: hypothetical protein D6695_12610 [Planctomycetota bacterium]